MYWIIDNSVKLFVLTLIALVLNIVAVVSDPQSIPAVAFLIVTVLAFGLASINRIMDAFDA
jgi:hypothetical protein